MKGVYTTASNHTCGHTAKLRNSQVQLDALNELLKTTIAEREALEQDLATKSAELSALRDRSSSANSSAQKQLDNLNQSFNTAQAEREALAETLATRTAELSLLRDQLSSANASNADATVLLNMLRRGMKEQGEEMQRTVEDLRRVRKDLNVMRVEKEEIGIPIYALRAEIAGLKLQNSRLKSEITHQSFQRPDDVPADPLVRDFDKVFRPRFEQREDLLKKSQPLIECGICMEKYPEDQMISLEPCGHKLCRNCVKNYVGTKLAERSFPVLCPVCVAEGRKEDPGSV
jgi:chromosome segregation ATPase